MTPRKDSDFYKLKEIYQKICYLNGMPKPYITSPDRDPEFVSFKCNSRGITAAQQKKAYDTFKENLGASHSAFYLAHPHDREALAASCHLLRRHAQRGFGSFEFVSAFEDIPYRKGDDGEVKDLYIILGANEKDTELTQRIRRWIRSPHGASIWVVGVVSDPYRWASDSLGCVPDYMFWMKKSGVSVG